MGMFKDAKIQGVVDQAAMRYREGRKVFVVQMADSPKLQGQATELDTIGLLIEGVEAEGWELAACSGGDQSNGRRTVVVGTFRRAVRPVMRTDPADQVAVRYSA